MNVPACSVCLVQQIGCILDIFICFIIRKNKDSILFIEPKIESVYLIYYFVSVIEERYGHLAPINVSMPLNLNSL